jgi:hypothetical protein
LGRFGKALHPSPQRFGDRGVDNGRHIPRQSLGEPSRRAVSASVMYQLASRSLFQA